MNTPLSHMVTQSQKKRLNDLFDELCEDGVEPDPVRPLMTRKRVAEYLDIGLDKLDYFRTTNGFPKPLRLGGERRMLRWKPEEIEEWALRERSDF